MINWIASYPKSGNTWVRRIVSLALFGDKNIDQLRYDIPSFADICHQFSGLDQPISDTNLIKLWKTAQLDIVKNSGGSKTILKTHNIAALMDGVVFPDLTLIANSVYIIRDPRDIVISWSKHSNKSISEAEDDLLNESFAIDKKTATSRKEILSSWENHFLGWSNSKIPSLVIRYEDMLNDSLAAIKQILEQLQIEPVISFPKIQRLASFENLQRIEAENGFVERRGKDPFFRVGRSGQWKDENFDFEKLEHKFSKTMRQFDYVS